MASPERGLDAVALEIERIGEGQRFLTQALAERDRVRDLLDKNVSPAVAAQLLRDGAALGGEEREVTILFADLRGFTSISETHPAPVLLEMARDKKIDMPISTAVADVIAGRVSVDKAIESLLSRPIKEE